MHRCAGEERPRPDVREHRCQTPLIRFIVISAEIAKLQFERKANGVFNLGHRSSGKLAQLALKPGFDQRANTLDVDDGCLVQKGKVA